MNILKNNHVDNSMLINECLESLALVLEYDLKDFPSHQHAIRVGEGCVLIGEKVGLDAVTLQRMYYAGLLHDVGKIAIDTGLLARKGRLSEEEFQIVKQHTIFGSRILAPLPGLSQLALLVRWHHEWWDGSGYPDGLKGNEIPIEVQILSAIDCFDSMQTPRLDRDRLTPEKAYEIIKQEIGSHFNPEIIDLLFEMIKEKTLIPGKSSNKFLELKKKYVDVPIKTHIGEYADGTDIIGLYPILRLFARVIDAKHKYTRGHSTRVSILAKYIADKMKLPAGDIFKVEAAGLLHDAGKVSVPLNILDKPGRPDDKEWDSIKQHPGFSYSILNKISSLIDIAEVAASHHERHDGTGYPDNLKGDEINPLSQIIALADTYDAITSSRAYRKGQSPEYAFSVIKDNLNTQFNPEIGKFFLSTPPKYIEALFDMYEISSK